MIENTEALFYGSEGIIQVKSKKEYEGAMEFFKNHGAVEMDKILGAIDEATDKDAACAEFAQELVEKVKETFSKRGKIKMGRQMEINLYMVYYIFPYILMAEKDYSQGLCDKLQEVWAKSFKNSDIKYATYDSILGGFQTRILGIPIGTN